jgi:protein YIPF1/2
MLMRRGTRYDFSKVTSAAAVIYCYVFVLPIMLSLALRCFAVGVRLTLLEMVCLYGYALSPFLVAAALCTIHNEVWRWCLVGLTGLLSGAHSQQGCLLHAHAHALPGQDMSS